MHGTVQMPLINISSTLSDGKTILQNLSINSAGSIRPNYSAENNGRSTTMFAELCGSSLQDVMGDVTVAVGGTGGGGIDTVDGTLHRSNKSRDYNEERSEENINDIVWTTAVAQAGAATTTAATTAATTAVSTVPLTLGLDNGSNDD
jgi:hypothetical protein